jgi:hypothetical protein
MACKGHTMIPSNVQCYIPKNKIEKYREQIISVLGRDISPPFPLQDEDFVRIDLHMPIKIDFDGDLINKLMTLNKMLDDDDLKGHLIFNGNFDINNFFKIIEEIKTKISTL